MTDGYRYIELASCTHIISDADLGVKEIHIYLLLNIVFTKVQSPKRIAESTVLYVAVKMPRARYRINGFQKSIVIVFDGAVIIIHPWIAAVAEILRPRELIIMAAFE